MSSLTPGDPLRSDQTHDPIAPPPPEKTVGQRIKRVMKWLLGGFVALIVLGAILGDDTPPKPIPDVVGMAPDAAKERLETAGYDVDEDDQADVLDFKTDNNVVCSTTPAAGRTADGDVTILVKSSDCRTDAAKAADEAREEAQAVARAERIERRQARQRRRAARRRAERRAVRAAAVEAAAPTVVESAPAEEASDCDPNYEDACLDPASSDYDCEGGSGDGPDYTGYVRVVGSDPYDLDRDGDGIACES